MSKKLKIINEFSPVIKPLSSEDWQLLQDFDTGDKYAFNIFIKDEAYRDMNYGDNVTYLVINEKEDSSEELVAYYSISAGTVNIVDRYDFEDDEIPEEEKREHFSPISSIYINMFAVDKKYQDAMYNDSLISGMILRKIVIELKEISTNIIGAKMITLCSVKDAVKFYKTNADFEELESKYTLLDKADINDTVPMKLALHTI